MEKIPIFLSHIETQLRFVNPLSITTRLFLAVFIGFLVGIDRTKKRRPAGVKTHVLVCMGSALVMIMSQYISQNLGYGGDIGRMGAQVISGIGFLGAGTILTTRENNVKGLTTAAGLWCSACLGLAAGIGFYEGVIIASVFIFIVIVWLPRFSSYLYGKTRLLDLYLEVDDPKSISLVVNSIKNMDCKIVHLNIGKVKYSTLKGVSIQVSLLLNKEETHNEIMSAIGDVKGIRFMEEIGEL